MSGGFPVSFFWKSIFNISVGEYLPESSVKRLFLVFFFCDFILMQNNDRSSLINRNVDGVYTLVFTSLLFVEGLIFISKNMKHSRKYGLKIALSH